MIRGVHHVAVSTPDAERMLRYYRDLLGCELVFDTSWEPGTELADRILALEGSSARQLMLRAGNCYLEIFEYHTPEPRPRNGIRPVNDHGFTHFALDVTDIDAEYERLTAAGMEFHCPPVDVPGGGVRMCYSRDPDGNVVELQELSSDRHPIAVPGLSTV